MISVHSEYSDEVKRAKDIFERAGAHTISRTLKKKVFSSKEERRVQIEVVAGPRARRADSQLF